MAESKGDSVEVMEIVMWQIFRKKDDLRSAEALRQGKKDFFALGVSILIVLIVINFLSSRHFFRIDLTEENTYTLSDSTKNILKNLDDVVNIHVYFSKDLPPMLMNLKQNVDDILDEYTTYAGSKLNVLYIDPQEDFQKEQQIQMMGIPPVQVNVIERDKQEVAKLYLGMAVTHEDRKEIMPVVQNVMNLEYELTAAIVNVSEKERPSIKWFSDAGANEYMGIKELLKKRYLLTDIDPENVELDPKKDALLVLVLEGDISDKMIFGVDQYLMGGGRIIVLTDRVKIAGGLQAEPVESNILKWLSVNGISVKDQLILDRINVHAAFSGGYVTYHVPYPYWIKIPRVGFDQSSPMVSDLDMLVLPWASPVEIKEPYPEGVVFEALAKSSEFSLETGLDSPLMPEKAQQIVGGGNYNPVTVAVLASGRLKSAFAAQGMTPPAGSGDVLESAEDGQVVVVGNTRFIQNNFLKQFAPNSIFFENAVDYLAMGSELIGIRSKGVVDRPIYEISQSAATFIKYLNIFGMSVIVVIAGLFIFMLKRQKMKALESAYR